MKKDITYYNQLAERYFDAETTADEERELVAFLCSSEANAPCYDEVRATMGYIVTARRRPKPTRRLVPYARRWAAAACLFLVACSGWVFYHQYGADEDCIVYIAGERVKDDAFGESYMIHALSETLASGDECIMEDQLQEVFNME